MQVLRKKIPMWLAVLIIAVVAVPGWYVPSMLSDDAIDDEAHLRKALESYIAFYELSQQIRADLNRLMDDKNLHSTYVILGLIFARCDLK